MKKPASMALAVSMLSAVLGAPVPAQQRAGDLMSPPEIERVQTEKKAWIALNMDLKPDEAEVFWPVYESYQKELRQINLRLIKLIEAYALHYRNNTLTDDAARTLTQEALAVDEAELKLRRSYFNRLGKVLSARKTARYLQLEGRVHTQVRYELAANLPLAGDVRPDIPSSVK